MTAHQVNVLRHQLAWATAIGDRVAVILLRLRLRRAVNAEPWSELEKRYRWGDR